MANQVQFPGLELAERVAEVARALGIETALIGAMAMAVHKYVRGTSDVDLATNLDSINELRGLQAKLDALGLMASTCRRARSQIG